MPAVKKPARSPASRFTFIAVSYDGGNAIPAFEKTQYFWAYYLAGSHEMRRKELLSVGRLRTSDLTARMADSMFDVIISGNFGGKAMAELKKSGKRLYTFAGGTDAAFNAYMNKELTEI